MTASGSDSCIGAVKYVGAGPLTHWKVLFYNVLEKYKLLQSTQQKVQTRIEAVFSFCFRCIFSVPVVPLQVCYVLQALLMLSLKVKG